MVGMTGLPEVVLARELEMCYASICMVSNYAASVSPDKITIDEVFEMLEEKKKSLTQLIYHSLMNILRGEIAPANVPGGCRGRLI